MRYRSPMCPSSGTVWLPAAISESPCGPIAKPPISRPIRPGSPARAKTIGPSRITANRTRNSSTTPEGASIAAMSSGTSVLRQDQRDVVDPSAEPARDEPIDRSVGFQGADRRVDDLAVVRSARQRRREALATAQLPEDAEALRVAAREPERNREVEQ